MKLKPSSLLLLLPIFFTMQCFIRVFPDSAFKSDALVETVIMGTSKDKILIIPIEGIISDVKKTNILGIDSESLLSSTSDQIQKAMGDPAIKGIILKINSPGGTVTTSDIIYRQILQYRRTKNIPIHSLFMDTSASGAYYIAMATEHITAHPTTITGSIGVVLSGLNVSEGMKKLGIQNQTVTSGKNKTIGSPLEPVSPEQMAILQNMVDDLYNRFFTIVKNGRPGINQERLKSLADGRVFTASQALSAGLIDKIGYVDDAIQTMVKDPSFRRSEDFLPPKIIRYTNSRQSPKNLYSSEMQTQGLFNKVLSDAGLSGFLYLWQPGL